LIKKTTKKSQRKEKSEKNLQKNSALWFISCYNAVEESMEEDVNMDVKNLSRYIIGKFQEKEIQITNLKLQKILYYVQGYFLKKYHRAAFASSIFNWPYGPVVKEAYFEYSDNGARPITTTTISTDINGITETDKKIINAILEKTYYESASKLVEKTHNEMPWKSTVTGQEISIQSINSFFRNYDPLNIGDKI